MAQSIKFGGNTFRTSSIPLAYGGRYLILEPHSSRIAQVSVLYADDVKAFTEVHRNKPRDNPFTSGKVSPSGTVTISDKSTRDFLYKIRPASETSVTFGKIKGTGVEAAITDTSIVVYRVAGDGSRTPMATLQSNTFSGPMIAVLITDDGEVAVGSTIPGELLSKLKLLEG